MSAWLTISEIELKTGIPNQTLRRYIRLHGHHLRTTKRHKSYMVAEESVSVLTQIRDRYANGATTEEVEDYLAAKGIPVTITVNDHGEQVNISASEALEYLRKDIKEAMNVMAQEIIKLRHEIALQSTTDEFKEIVQKVVREEIAAAIQEEFGALIGETRVEYEQRREKEMKKEFEDLKQKVDTLITETRAERHKKKTLWQRLFGK